jgi:hypothetical protein
MSNFWDNVFRYPKFFITSVIGLVVVIISPFKKLSNNPNTRFLFIITCSILILFVLTVLVKMIEL